MERTNRVYLTRLRGAEHSRMTYPFTVPVRFQKDPLSSEMVDRIEGIILETNPGSVAAEFSVPPDAPTGLWRAWLETPAGVVDGPRVEVSNWAEYAEARAGSADWRKGPF